MRRLLAAVIAIPLLFASAMATAQQVNLRTPDLLSIGGGYLGVIKFAPNVAGADLRGEYRWGVSLLPLISSYFNVIDPYIQIHPALGLEVTSRGAVYAEYSFIAHIPIGDHFFEMLAVVFDVLFQVPFIKGALQAGNNGAF